MQAVGLVERVQRVHRVKERVISNESSLLRRRLRAAFGNSAPSQSTITAFFSPQKRALGGYPGVEGDELAEALGDVCLVEFDDKGWLRTQLVTEENQKSDCLLVNVNGTFAFEPLDDHILTHGAQAVEDEVVGVHREETYGDRNGGGVDKGGGEKMRKKQVSKEEGIQKGSEDFTSKAT